MTHSNKLDTQAILTYIESADIDNLRKIRLAADKKIKATTKANTKVKPLLFSPTAMESAKYLWSTVHQRYPFMPEPNLENWAVDIERLNRIDKCDWPVIKAVLLWSQQDSFWRQQVRSGGNLRKHFTQMLVRIKEERNMNGGISI